MSDGKGSDWPSPWSCDMKWVHRDMRDGQLFLSQAIARDLLGRAWNNCLNYLELDQLQTANFCRLTHHVRLLEVGVMNLNRNWKVRCEPAAAHQVGVISLISLDGDRCVSNCIDEGAYSSIGSSLLADYKPQYLACHWVWLLSLHSK